MGLFFDKYWIVLNSDWVQFEGLGQAAKLHVSRREGGLRLLAHLGACTLPKGGGESAPSARTVSKCENFDPFFKRVFFCVKSVSEHIWVSFCRAGKMAV